MLRGKDFVNSKGYSKRHLSANDYYEKGKKIEGHWIGQACQRYGVVQGAVVEDAKFELLKDNRHAITKEQITVRQNTTRQEWVVGEDGKLNKVQVPNRRQFYDFTLSIPKTWSAAAIPGGDERVLKWHRQASAKTRTEMEKWTARHLHNQDSRVEVTGQFVAAWYEHTADRCLMPQVHDHIVIFNMTPGADGRDYAVEARQWMDACDYFTAVYRDELAKQARAAGVEVVIDRHGAPQIKSLLDLVPVYSQRSTEIEDLVGKIEERVGIKLSTAERKTIGMACRGLDLDRFEEVWNLNKDSFAKLNELQSPEAERGKLRREQLAKFTSLLHARGVFDGNLVETTTAEVIANQLAILTPEQRYRLTSFKHQEPIQQQEVASLEEAIEFAIDHVFTRKSVVTAPELYETIVQAAQGTGVDLERMKELLEIHPELRLVRGEYTTKTHLARELEIVEWMNDGRGRGIKLEWDGDAGELSRSQENAVRKLAGSDDQFQILVGRAGVGKTRGLKKLVGLNLDQGRKVFVCAPDNGARDVLRKECETIPPGAVFGAFKGAENLHRFLVDPKLKNGMKRGDLLVLDEAGKTSVEKLHELAQWATDRGVRVLLVGDPRQLGSVDAGDALAIAIRLSNVLKVRLTEIIRQHPDALDGRYLKAAKLLSMGKTTAAFAQLDQAGVIIEHKGKARVEAMADGIVREHDLGRSVIAVNPSHKENDAVSEAVRQRLKERRSLSDERLIKAHRSLGWTYAEKRRINNIKPGQILEIIRGKDKGRTWMVTSVARGKAVAVSENGERRDFARQNAKMFDVCEPRDLLVCKGDKLITYAGQRTKNGEIINGERVTVTGWGPSGEIIGEEGKVISIRNLSYAYVATSHKSQGDTAQKVLFGLDRNSIRWVDQKIAYVAGTRGKTDIEVYVENKQELTGIQDRTGDRKAATDLCVAENRAEELIQELRELRRRESEMTPIEARKKTEELIRQQMDVPQQDIGPEYGMER